MELVAFLGSDAETYGQITGLISRGEWEKIVLVKTKDSKDFPKPENGEVIQVDSSKKLIELREEISKKVKEKLSGLEVALSIASGNGKEHMALISSLLMLPVGIRFVVFTKNGVEFIN
ncbi:hypothetical protein COU62_03560 [Candidatus Pacearchaeota archaeon CG10_big_fil_rev_8_21_14_0_10_35_219]|nr:hypothetical protein [Candidatus Pacearchaeota archaeon]OIO42336.1 MAG: hypothetical protein AUJ63_03615 [Candidatus Pacearchaeota archaeon CG1_02_35_32]PIO07429.1 MAG: hypothetical protein COU62_03560 [Candidatus Pacearchaeota archaeon CG10_big_fil_rev_8_21_14_0_10_35_219]PIY81235.1 MAG: hypothetical protein COY79_03055 [Candidatus Pacearchaeota archaeon CG_4_10_14_0_8_um_filter_35_169]PIZ80165.1 MAG: hypothetical protein COY00_01705 [Candidatus Pacearchaeota archaeon CG_4_10_14_0_2_um_filt